MKKIIFVEYENDQGGPMCGDIIQITSEDQLRQYMGDYFSYELLWTTMSIEEVSKVINDHYRSPLGPNISDYPDQIGYIENPVDTMDYREDEKYEIAEVNRILEEIEKEAENPHMKALSDLTKREYNQLEAMGLLKQTFPEATGDYNTDTSGTREVTVYLHKDRDEMFSKGQELGLKDDALRNFETSLYEVALKLKVDVKTGNVEVISTELEE